MVIKSFKELTVWQKAMDLNDEIYRITGFLPDSEKFKLSSQMRGASVSIPSNIAEGRTRRSRREYIQFLRVSYASAAELETQLEIVKRIYKVVDVSVAERLLIEVRKMTATMIRKLSVTKPAAHL